MKSGICNLILRYVCVLVISACTPLASATQTPLPTITGEWVATDPVDGSNLTLTISPADNGSYNLTYNDDGARVCGEDSAGKPKFAIKIEFTGILSENVLHAASTSATCLSTPSSPFEGTFSSDYSYDASTDTLSDSLDQTVWKRK